MSTWIPTTKQLPDADLTVIITHPDWDDPVILGFTDGEDWYDQTHWDAIEPAPTHWTHLPEPPEVTTL